MPRITTRNVLFIVATLLSAWLAHAMAYLTHEYAHSIAAWLLGWMSSPFDIDYGPPSLGNLLFLGDVSDNVSYDPIFAAGQGVRAALIALAGPYVGNGFLYVVLAILISKCPATGYRYLGMLLYWLALMCAANVWSYVPIRSITTHADIALAARGFGVSVWVFLPLVLLPSLAIAWHFFFRLFPVVYPRLVGDSVTDFVVLIAYTGFWYFSFFAGSDVIDGRYGTVSQVLAIVSRYVMFPLCVGCLWTMRRPEPAAADRGER